MKKRTILLSILTAASLLTIIYFVIIRQPRDTSGHINVTNHGIVGDNTTNNARTISDLINDTETVPHGSTIFFPAGTYKVGSTIFLTRGNITLLGEEGSIIYLDAPLRWLFDTTWGDITFDSLTLVNAGIHINSERASNITVQNCTFLDIVNYESFHAGGGGNNIQIINNRIINQGPGAWGGIMTFHTSDLLIKNNHFYYVGQPISSVVTRPESQPHNSDNIRIIGNYARNISRVGIEIQNQTINTNPNYITGLEIRDNHFEDWIEFHWVINWTEQMGISIPFYCEGAVIAGNTPIWGNRTYPRHCWGIEVASFGTLVEYNHIDGFREGISTSHSRNNIIRNNVLQNIHDVGITNYDWVSGPIGTGAKFDGTIYEGNQLINIGRIGINGTWDRTMGTNPIIIRNNTIVRTPGHFEEDGTYITQFVGINIHSRLIDVTDNEIIFEEAIGRLADNAMHLMGIRMRDMPPGSATISGNSFTDMGSAESFGFRFLSNVDLDGYEIAGNSFTNMFREYFGSFTGDVNLYGNVTINPRYPGMVGEALLITEE